MRESCGMAAGFVLRAGHSRLFCAGPEVTPQNAGRPPGVRTTLGQPWCRVLVAGF